MGTSATIIPSAIITQNMPGQGQPMTGPGPQSIQGQVTNTMQTSTGTTPQTPFQGQTGQVLGPGANQGMQSGNLVLPPNANQGLQGPVPVSQNATVPPTPQSVTQQQQQQQQQQPTLAQVFNISPFIRLSFLLGLRPLIIFSLDLVPVCLYVRDIPFGKAY